MLTREVLVDCFKRLAALLNERDITGEIAIVGGAAIMLAFHAREATKDVDAIFAAEKEIRDAVRQVALEKGLPPDWLNDAAKGFLSARGDFLEQPILQFPGLRILAPSAEYLLAMKVLSARTGAVGGQGDKEDIRLLIDYLKLDTADQVMGIAMRYYDPSRVLPKSFYLVDEIMEERRK